MQPNDTNQPRIDRSLDERLEKGEVLTFSPCPFALPSGADLAFLFEQRLKNLLQKNITYNPLRDVVAGFHHTGDDQARRLRQLLHDFSQHATAWLGALFPAYAQAWQRDRASFRPEEEAVRRLRPTARNDLLHFDAFPSRPTRGHRILRLFVNVNPSDPRVWVTSETFGLVLERHGAQVGLPGSAGEGWVRRLGDGLLSLFQPGGADRTEYDHFMLRLHHFMKSSDRFQERSPKRFWHFAPGTAWLVFTDAVSHAELRGQFALEHSFFIAPHSLALPDESPAVLLEKACGMPVLPRAA